MNKEIFEKIAESPIVERAGHHLLEEGLNKVTEALDFDDDGSILDTLPDLIAVGIEGLSSLFG